MVRSIGIDPGDRLVNVVELDGSYRKTRLLGVSSTPIAMGDDPMRPDTIAHAVREALDGGSGGAPMKGEITLGHACREAVVRTIELPFKGADAIKKVVKSEIEGEIFTHSVDDMIVDFHEIAVMPSGGTKIMIAAVPKIGIRNQLASLSAEKIDPQSVDLDTMALWRVADWAGAFEDDDGDDDAEKPVHVVVDLGPRSVKILLTEGDQLIETRVLRLGGATVADQIARASGMSVEQARAVVADSLRTGADVRVDIAPDEFALVDDEEQEGSEAAELGEESAEPAASPRDSQQMQLVAYSDVEAAHTKFLQRLARELTRFLAATGLAVRVRSVWVTGEFGHRQGTAEMLEAVFGVAPQELDVLSHLSHDLDDDEAAALSPTLAVAMGHALGRLGGPEGFELRQEDLSLTGGFDRIKFPLAIACMVGLLTLFVFANQQSMRLQMLELELGMRHPDPDPKVVQWHGHLNTLFAGKWFQDKRYFARKKGKRVTYAFQDLVDDLTEAPVHRRVATVRDKLKLVAKDKQKESGVYEDVSLESGLAVLVRWAEVIKSIEPELGRYLVPELDLDMARGTLNFTMAFRGEDFRLRKGAVESAFRREWGKPDSPFTEPKKAGATAPETPFKDFADKQTPGAYFAFSIRIKDSFPPFGPSARLGVLLNDDILGQPARDYLAAALAASRELVSQQGEPR